MSNLRQYPIAEWRRTYGLAAFVETGAYKGDSLLAALQAGYPKVVSCDVEPTFVEHCRGMLEHHGFVDAVRLSCGRSVDVLPSMLAEVVGAPILVFLDAHVDPVHFDGGLRGTDGGDPLPLRREIEVLLAARSGCPREWS